MHCVPSGRRVRCRGLLTATPSPWPRGRASGRSPVTSSPVPRPCCSTAWPTPTGCTRALAAWRRAEDAVRGPQVEIPVTYDGPDLETVAGHWGCDVDEVVRPPSGHGVRLGLLRLRARLRLPVGARRHPVPRLATPRTRVPAGSVALAGAWCGVYPVASPGGWQIIGHTDAELWDPGREEPALLAPGTRVRFVSR